MGCEFMKVGADARGREDGRLARDVHARGCVDKRICFVTASLQDSVQLAEGAKEKIEAAGCFGLVGQESVDLGAEVSVGRVMNGAGASVYNQLKCLKVVSHVPEGEC